MSRINTNIPSLVAQHRLNASQRDLNLRLERLSTGLRINSGKDDPAGLIASELLRSEIQGINQALENSSRVVNVLTTAEAALNEVSSLLLEVRGLINKSANRGALSEAELQANQLQINSLLESIDRIANGTQFAGEKLLNGNFAYSASGVATNLLANTTVFGARVPVNGSLQVRVEVVTSAEKATESFSGATISEDVTFEVTGNKGSQIFVFQNGASVDDIAAEINKFTAYTGVAAVASAAGIALQSEFYGASQFVKIKSITGNFIATQGQEAEDKGVDVGALINGQAAFAAGLKTSLRASGLDVELELTEDLATRAAASATTFDIIGGGALYQIGPNVSPIGQINIGIPSVTTAHLGDNVVGLLNSIAQGGVNDILGEDETGENAERIVNVAINQIATIRGRLGGLQKNTIETNINSQNIALENVKAAESTIRDADYASEVAALTRAQILQQSGIATLGIANQIPQSVLALLG